MLRVFLKKKKAHTITTTGLTAVTFLRTLMLNQIQPRIKNLRQMCVRLLSGHICKYFELFTSQALKSHTLILRPFVFNDVFCSILSSHTDPYLTVFRERGRKIRSDDNKPIFHQQDSNYFCSRSHDHMRKSGEQIQAPKHRTAVFSSQMNPAGPHHSRASECPEPSRLL